MLDWLVVWGVSRATSSVLYPILEELAKDVAKDAAKSYVGQAFKNVFSVLYRDALTKATGLALKDLMELIHGELLDADLTDDQIELMVADIRKFIMRDELKIALAGLFLEPDYELDPLVFAAAWQHCSAGTALPTKFDWERVAKRFARAVRKIRNSNTELRQTFESLSKERDSEALRELSGLPPDFNLDAYREALVERFGNLKFDTLDATGAYYNSVRLWSVFVPQSVRECHEYTPQVLEIPKEKLRLLVQQGELNEAELIEAERLQEERRRLYMSQPILPVLAVVGENNDAKDVSERQTDLCDKATMKQPVASRTVVLGDPGSGKSCLLQFLALRWARIEDAILRYTQSLPILIELRDYNRWTCASGKSFLKYLHEAPTWHRLNQQTLDHLLKQRGRVVVLLDGLDEIFDPAERGDVLNDIHRFSNDYPNADIVVTSRVVGYQPQRLRDASFRHFMLEDLDADQMNRFLNKWHETGFDDQLDGELKKNRLSKAIKNSKSISQLAGNPLLLTMMAILNRHQELPRNRVDLYQQCARLLLHQWDVEGKLLKEFPGLNGEIGLREKTEILRRVAYAMQCGSETSPYVANDPTRNGSSGSNYINGDELTRIIEEYLRRELRFDQARGVARALVEQLRSRNFILCDLGGNSYAFVHRTFLEYFCAAEIVHRFNVSKSISIEELAGLFEVNCSRDDWREVLRLICGQIDERFACQIISGLASKVDVDKYMTLKFAELPLALYCLSETNCREIFTDVGRQLHQLVLRFLHCVEWFPYSVFEYDTDAMNECLGTILQDILSASAEIGTRWPSLASGATWALQGLSHFERQSSEHQPAGGHVYPFLVVSVTQDREIAHQLATNTDSATIRKATLGALVEHWNDDRCRQLLVERAIHDTDNTVRSQALNHLRKGWSDINTVNLLAKRAVEDTHAYSRSSAVEYLGQISRAEETRKILTSIAFNDAAAGPRIESLNALVGNWPDGATRDLLLNRVVDDVERYVRMKSLEHLARNWPDSEVREQVVRICSNDSDPMVRKRAVQHLVETWPDYRSIQLLAQVAVNEPDWTFRKFLVDCLFASGPSVLSFELLTKIAATDSSPIVRTSSLRAIGRLRDQLVASTFEAAPADEFATRDDPEFERAADLSFTPEKLIDLLSDRVWNDEDFSVRSTALELLRSICSSTETDSRLLIEARSDGAAAALAASKMGKFGRVLFSHDFSGRPPFLDPRRPIEKRHLRSVGIAADVERDKVDDAVQRVSEYLGWDITRGSQST